jgi:hypothetical protein
VREDNDAGEGGRVVERWREGEIMGRPMVETGEGGGWATSRDGEG